MATYVIGDVQGCFDSLVALLAKVAFDAQRDRLWLTGDLVNRGPKSLAVLRFVKNLGAAAQIVLGNHDLHLLGLASGVRASKSGDTLGEVLAAEDREALLTWLASQPLIFKEGAWFMVHAGLLPDWTFEDAERHARAIEKRLANPKERASTLDKNTRPEALRVLTTLRTCTMTGELCHFDGAPETAPKDCFPWFAHPRKRSRDGKILFGHWSALGFRAGPDYYALDSGCVWGRELSAIRLEDGQHISVKAQEKISGV